jgi:hypothetical protein
MSEDLPAAADQWRQSVLSVGEGGRGFVLAHERRRYVATAAHCLPFLPPPHGASYTAERTVFDWLGPLGEKPGVAAEIVFVDPVADIALLGSPDDQELYEEAEAYEALIEGTSPAPLTALEFVRQEHRLSNGETILGPPKASTDAWLFGLEGEWFTCRVLVGRSLWITDAAKPIVGGMSGSPIITRHGAVGVVCVSGDRKGGPNPYLPFALPGFMVSPPG